MIIYNHSESIRLLVYDRWGEEVFETTDIIEGWDGTLRKKDLNSAIFVYYLEVNSLNEEDFTEKGNITLIR